MNTGRILLTLFLILAPCAAQADPDTFYTRDFPDPDRAEITPTVYGSQAQLPDAKLDQKQAVKLANMLRTQKWWGTRAQLRQAAICPSVFTRAAS